MSEYVRSGAVQQAVRKANYPPFALVLTPGLWRMIKLAYTQTAG